MAEAEEKASATGYYEESKADLVGAVPAITVGVMAAVLLWLFGNLIFIPISEGIEWFGYPLTQILPFIIMAGLAFFVVKILVDVRRAVDALAALACEIGAPYDVTQKEVGQYKTELRSILYVIVVSLAFLLFSDYLTRIQPARSGVVLMSIVGWAAIVGWAMFEIWRAVKAISGEIIVD